MAKKVVGPSKTNRLLVLVMVLAFAVVGTYLILASYAAAPSRSCVTKTYASGSKGNCVKHIQTLLNYPNSTIIVDGKFGTSTKDAVIKRQQDYKSAFPEYSDIVVDGIVDPAETWYMVCHPQQGPAPDSWAKAYAAAGCTNAPGRF